MARTEPDKATPAAEAKKAAPAAPEKPAVVEYPMTLYSGQRGNFVPCTVLNLAQHEALARRGDWKESPADLEE